MFPCLFVFFFEKLVYGGLTLFSVTAKPDLFSKHCWFSTQSRVVTNWHSCHELAHDGYLWDTKRWNTTQKAPRRQVHLLVRARTLTSPAIGAHQPMTSAQPSLAFQRRPRTRPARPPPADTVQSLCAC